MRSTALLTMGAVALTLFPDGRVLVVVPPAQTPFGATLTATAVYPSLAAFLVATRRLPFAT